MGRPSLPLGTYGKIRFVRRPSGGWQARTLFRDQDGRTRPVSRNAVSRAAAERALKQALTERAAPSSGDGALVPTTKVGELADLWLTSAGGLSVNTRRVYGSIVKNQIKPVLGNLTLQEVNPGVVSRALTRVASENGPGAARSTRACLSSMFTIAIQDGAVRANPVRDAAVVKGARPIKTAPRALTATEVDKLTAYLRSAPKAVQLDVADIADWMLATGCRIGEALALRFGTGQEGGPLLDLEAGTWEVDATVVREIGRGLIVQDRTKTAAGWRIVALPDYAVDLVRRRMPLHERNTAKVVFAAHILGAPRDPSNVSADLRQLVDGFECEMCNGTGYQLESNGSFKRGPKNRKIRCADGPWSWVTSHTFRKTVATRLDEAGFSARQVADQLGHANPSMTQDVYFGRRVVSAEAASVLNR